MNRTTIIGTFILLGGIAINFAFDSKMTDITGAVLIGLGIGVLLTGRFGNA